MKSWTMCERNAFYIQASCLCLEAISLRDSEQPAENITNYQVPLSQICCGLGLVVFPFFFDGLDWAESKKMDPRTTVVGLWLEGWQCRRCTTDRTGVLRRLCCERAATRHQVLSCRQPIVCSCACTVTARYHSEDSRQRTPPVTQPANSLSASLSQSPANRSSDSIRPLYFTRVINFSVYWLCPIGCSYVPHKRGGNTNIRQFVDSKSTLWAWPFPNARNEYKSKKPSLPVVSTTLATQIFAWLIPVYGFQFRSGFHPPWAISAVTAHFIVITIYLP